MSRTISIAMTTYNGERYLREQLDSIYSQTHLPDEVVVCDDNSSDGTIAILEEYKARYGLKYYINSPGLGVNENFYKAMSLCSSDYIALSDQDDIWLPDKIENTYNKLMEIDDGRPSVVSSLCLDANAEGKVIKYKSDLEDSYGCAATLLSSGRSQGCSLMMNRSLVELVLKTKNTDERIALVMFDVYISFVAATLGKKYNLGKRLMLYRHHQNNVVAKANIKNLSFRERLKKQDMYPGFIPNQRFESIRLMSDLYYSHFDDETKYIVDHIILIEKSSFFKSLYHIALFRDLPIKRRVKIVCKSLGVKMCKMILR